MLRWTSVLLLAAPVVLLIFALRRARDEQRAASLRTIFIIYVLSAAAPLVFAILWRLDATRIVIELHGIAFRGSGANAIRKDVRERRQGSGRIVIGDVASRKKNPADRRFGTLVYQPGAGEAKGEVSVELPPPAERAGLVGTGSAGLLGAEALLDGDRVCVDSACWTYGESDASFTYANRVWRIPPRQAEIPGLDWTFDLPFAEPIPASLRTWSIDWLAHDGGVLPPDRRLRSFFCYSKPESRLRFVSMDRNVTLQRNGQTVTSKNRLAITVEEKLSFYTLPNESSVFAAPGIAERRSMVVRAGGRSFALDLDTPEIHSVTVAELRALELAREKNARTMNVALSMGDAQLVDRSLYFSGISESVAVEANALFELARSFPRNLGSTFGIVSPRGPLTGSLGAVHWLGASDLAAIRFDVLRPPLLLLIIGAGLLLLKIVAAWSARLSTTQTLIAGALELLVGVRLLLGYRVWSMPPHRIEAAELATVAWMALPWMFLAASLPVRRLRARFLSSDAAPALAGTLLSAVFMLLIVGGRTRWIWFLAHFAAVAVALLRADEVRQRMATLRRPKMPRIPEKLAAVGAWFIADELVQRMVRAAIAAAMAWLFLHKVLGLAAAVIVLALAAAAGFFAVPVARWSGRFIDDETKPILVAALLFTAARLVLLLFGFKESFSFGVRVSLSVVHIPLAAWLEGYFLWRTWQRIRANGRLTAPDQAAAVMILVFVWCVPAVLTSDIGLALLNVPLFALLFLAVARHAPSGSRALVPRILVILVILFIAGAPLLRLVLPFISNEEFLLAAASDSNYARFLHFAAPERLREMATKRGESLAITSALLQSYISSGLFGRGYGHSEVSPHLGDTALRDFAPAVFVASEWGLVGTVAALLIYLLFAIAAQPWLPWSGGAAGGRGAPAAAYVAAATVAVSSCYMILANHELLLLTGKNAYLLGLDSAGDVMEMLVLVLVMAYGAAIARGESEAFAGGSA